MTTFRLAYDKTVALGYRMDVVFYLLRIGLFCTDHELIKSNLEKAQRYLNSYTVHMRVQVHVHNDSHCAIILLYYL